MPRRGSERSTRYSSDYSSSEDDHRHRQRRPQRRDRTVSDDSYTTRRSRYSGRARSERAEPGSANLGKASIAVGLISVFAGLIQLWTVRKNAEREREAKRERQEKFERSKAARRKEEAKRDGRRSRHVDQSPPSEVRRIGQGGYARSPSPVKATLRLEAPPQGSARASGRSSPRGRDHDYDDDSDYDDDRRSRRG